MFGLSSGSTVVRSTSPPYARLSGARREASVTFHFVSSSTVTATLETLSFIVAKGLKLAAAGLLVSVCSSSLLVFGFGVSIFGAPARRFMDYVGRFFAFYGVCREPDVEFRVRTYVTVYGFLRNRRFFTGGAEWLIRGVLRNMSVMWSGFLWVFRLLR